MTDQQIQAQVERAKASGFPYFQIKCDDCGYVDSAMCEGSDGFEFCDGSCGTLRKHRGGDIVGNYQVKELTGQYPELADYRYITRS